MALTKVSYSMITGAQVNVFDYMTAEQITDVQAGTLSKPVDGAIQAAVTANASGGVIVFPIGKYLITKTITKSESSVGPSFQGQGFNQTQFYYPNISTGGSFNACLYIQGGSGAVESIFIDGIGFYGALSDTTTVGTKGIVIDGQDGVIISNCLFDLNKFGIHYWNNTAGAFTEYCVAEQCEFTANCGVKIYYSVTSGATSSFNGSGFRNCTMNIDTGVFNDPCVVVEDGSLVYNAPMGGQIWLAGSSAGVVLRNNNSGTLNCYWYGTLTLESFGSNLVLCQSANTTRNFYIGSIVSLNQYYDYGTLTVCHDYHTNSDASINASKKTWSVTGTATTGTTSVNLNFPPADSALGIACSYILNVYIAGTNYIYTHVLSFVPGVSEGATAYVATIQNAQQFNAAAWGICTFGVGGSLGSPTLTITNSSSGFSVNYQIGVLQIGWNQP